MVVLIDDSVFYNIAQAIRDKKGTEETFAPEEMASAIADTSTGGGSGEEQEKTTTTVKVMGVYDKYNSYCGIWDEGEIKPADGTTYNEVLEIDKSKKIYIVASASATANEEYALITLNGEIVHNTTGSYPLELADYSIVYLVFTEQYDGRFITCSIVTG